MLQLIWVIFTTAAGWGIETWMNNPDPATWIGPGLGFLFGVCCLLGDIEAFGDIAGGLGD